MDNLENRVGERALSTFFHAARAHAFFSEIMGV